MNQFKIRHEENDLPHHHQLQPGKTKMHSAYIRFCSCGAQQMNTVHQENVLVTKGNQTLPTATTVRYFRYLG